MSCWDQWVSELLMRTDGQTRALVSMETAFMLYCILSVQLYFITIYLIYGLHTVGYLRTIRLGTGSALLSYCWRCVCVFVPVFCTKLSPAHQLALSPLRLSGALYPLFPGKGRGVCGTEVPGDHRYNNTLTKFTNM